MSCYVIALLLVTLADPAATTPDRWAGEMARFEAADAAQPTAPGGVLFVGSSSIRLWDVKASFPDIQPLNRGFGGSEMGDIMRHLDLLILRHKPRAVVIYSGDNDLASGKTPRRVADDFQTIVDRVRAAMPQTKIILISPKPSLARWKLAEKIRQTNALLAGICAEADGVTFLDIWPVLLGEDGQPRPELFQPDGLHLNPAGYRLWTAQLAPLLK